MLERIEEAFQGLSEHPRRGNHPRELLDLGIRDYREVFFKPYRIIYRVTEGHRPRARHRGRKRRDMQSLLQRRLLQP